MDVLLLFLVCLTPLEVASFSTGAPNPACSTLSPDPIFHGAPPQTSQVPFTLNISDLETPSGSFEYVPGQTFTCKFNNTYSE